MQREKQARMQGGKEARRQRGKNARRQEVRKAGRTQTVVWRGNTHGKAWIEGKGGISQHGEARRGEAGRQADVRCII